MIVSGDGEKREKRETLVGTEPKWRVRQHPPLDRMDGRKAGGGPRG